MDARGRFPSSTGDGREEGARDRVLALLRRHGWNATSFQILEHGFAYWFDPAADAVVAYVDTGSAWVVAGAPIAAESDLSASASRFVDTARRARRRVAFFAVEDRFADLDWMESIPIGEQPAWDPATWSDVVGSSRSLREQLRRARAKGVTARELGREELEALAREGTPLRRRAEALVAGWLASRKMAPMGFLVDVQLFHAAEERRAFVAEREGELVAMLVAVPVYARSGWLFEDLLRENAVPNGTTELLVDAGMRAVAATGARFATLGLAPLAGDLGPWLRFARELSKALYDFHGVHRFRAKLKPTEWTPIHLAWPREGGSANVALYDALAAFTIRGRDGHDRASFVRFGLETLAHAPALAVRVLAILLVPWTALLALAPTERFFPSHAVHVGWVVWDVMLAIAMFALAARWRTALARALAFGTSLDALLTIVQVLGFDRGRTRSGLEMLGLVVACAGPVLATSLLWGALAWRARGLASGAAGSAS